ncbi:MULTISPECIES: acyl-CoA dehydrogenase family protein [Streptomyces]|uniref:Acyl-CoA dehydrogenase family protein n=1 Tax=Streptomyces luteosporeus TaxID=173856 RepID=A0ABP6G525_9ACTN
MHFRLNDDQRSVQSAARALLEARFPRERLREAVDSAAPQNGPDRALWQQLGEAGFFSLRLPAEAGGAGLGLAEAVLVLEEAGRCLLPGPLVATQLAAGLVPGAAEGRAVVTAPDGCGTVEHLAAADAVLLLDDVAVRMLPTAGGAGPVALSACPLHSVDPTTSLHLVELPLPDQGSPAVEMAGDPARTRAEAALLTAALQLGNAARTLEMAVTHVTHRRQFGRPVGAFQAVQHVCAQMLVRTEIARSSVYAASLTATHSEVAAAKLLADEAAVRNARDCLQLHGGIGFTWEADVHPYLKRAWLRAAQWQPARDAEELLACALLDESGNCGQEIANDPNDSL